MGDTDGEVRRKMLIDHTCFLSRALSLSHIEWSVQWRCRAGHFEDLLVSATELIESMGPVKLSRVCTVERCVVAWHSSASMKSDLESAFRLSRGLHRWHLSNVLFSLFGMLF